MFGLKAIAANNGWEYAILGVSIVFSGLVLLSFVISQLHKLLDFWENRTSLLQSLKDDRKNGIAPSDDSTAVPKAFPGLNETLQQYQMIVDRIGEPFSLPRLLKLAESSGLHRPHAAINDLLQAGVIVPDNSGYYIMKNRS